MHGLLLLSKIKYVFKLLGPTWLQKFHWNELILSIVKRNQEDDGISRPFTLKDMRHLIIFTFSLGTLC